MGQEPAAVAELVGQVGTLRVRGQVGLVEAVAAREDFKGLGQEERMVVGQVEPDLLLTMAPQPTAASALSASSGALVAPIRRTPQTSN